MQERVKHPRPENGDVKVGLVLRYSVQLGKLEHRLGFARPIEEAKSHWRSGSKQLEIK